MQRLIEPRSGETLASSVYANATLAGTDIAIGNGYYNSTTAQWEEMLTAITSSVTNRAGSRKFPIKPLVIAEAGRVSIWDVGSGEPRLWRVRAIAGCSSIETSYGVVVVGTSTGVFVDDYPNDSIDGLVKYSTTTIPAIVNNTVNDVSITHLPDAPIRNGVKVLTVYAACATGISRIADDRTVSSTTTSGVVPIKHIYADADFVYAAAVHSGSSETCLLPVTTILSGSSTWLAITWNALGGFAYSRSENPPFIWSSAFQTAAIHSGAVAHSKGISLVKHNPANTAEFLQANINNTYNTGYMVGDTRRCFLANSKTLDRSVKGGTLVENGTITETVNAGGRNVYSGFSAANYFSEASHADWNNIGTGDFSIIFEELTYGFANTHRAFITIGDQASAGSVHISATNGNVLLIQIHGGAFIYDNYWASGAVFTGAAAHTLVISRRAGVMTVCLDDAELAGTTVGNIGASISNTTGQLKLFATSAAVGTKAAVVKISLTAPAAEQSLFIAQESNKLNNGTPCLLSSSSNTTGVKCHTKQGVYHVPNGANVDEFKGLRRNDFMVKATGITDSGNPLAAPMLSTSGTVNYYKAPEVDVVAEALSVVLPKQTQRFKFSGDGVVTAFKLDIAANAQGWKPQDVYLAGLLQSESETADYVVDSYGVNTYGITFAVAPAAGTNNIIIQAEVQL